MNSHPPARRAYVQAIAALFVVAASVAPGPLDSPHAPLGAPAVSVPRSGTAGEDLTFQIDEPSGGSQARRLAAQAGAALSPAPGPADGLLAPVLGTTIEGINFDENETNSGDYSIPPDPHGAAGPDHVVSVVNTSIEWHTKAGTQLTSTSLADFFAALTPLTNAFDPKVIYDQYNDRFVVVALEQTDTFAGDAANTSRIFVAVSDDDNPEGDWYAREIDSEIIITGTATWADYPGLGLDGSAVYITANMFTFGAVNTNKGERMWILATSGWYSDGALTVTLHNPAAASGASATTMQPAHMYGTVPAGMGTFLAFYSGLTDGTDEYLGVIQVSHPLTTPIFSYDFVNLGNLETFAPSTFPGAPQPLTTTVIHTGDRRALSAVWRDDALWASASLLPASGGDTGEVTAHWFKIDTSVLATPTLADQGNVGGDDIDSGAFTFYPSVMVDQDGNMGIGFALSGPSTFAGAYYTGREAGDAAGTVESTGTLAAGVAEYNRKFGGSRNRWGDYSGIALDPADESVFWVFNEYALITGTVLGSYPGENGRWGTRWGKFGFKQTPAITITSDLPDPSVPGQAVTVAVSVTGPSTTPTGTITVTASSGQGTCSNTLAAGSASCVITPTLAGVHTLTVTYSGNSVYDGAPSAPASHTVQNPIAGLAAANSSPTGLGQTTLFTATVVTGTSPTFAWNFGDGGIATGGIVTHTYALTGTYTAVVTATNSTSMMTATTTVEITSVYKLHLPIVLLMTGAAQSSSSGPAAHAWGGRESHLAGRRLRLAMR